MEQTKLTFPKPLKTKRPRLIPPDVSETQKQAILDYLKKKPNTLYKELANLFSIDNLAAYRLLREFSLINKPTKS